MITVSSAFAAKLNSDSRTFKARFLDNGTPVQCDIKSIMLYKGASTEIVPGAVYIPYFEAQLSWLQSSLAEKTLSYQIGMDISGTDEWVTLGSFYVAREDRRGGAVTIQATGMLGARCNDIITIAAGTTIAAAISAVQTECGCTITVNGLSTTGSITNAMTATCLEILGEVARLMGGFVTESNSGSIVIAKYGSGSTLAVDGDRMTVLPDAGSTIHTVTGVKVLVKEGGQDEEGQEIPEVAFTHGVPNVAYQTANMTQALFDAVVQNLEGYTFTPADVVLALGDPRLEPWDSLVVTEPGGDVYTVPCLRLVFKFDGGLQTEVNAKISSDSEKEVQVKGPIQKALDTLTAQMITANDAIMKRATIAYLVANYAHITNGVIDNATIDYADVNNLAAHYAHITNGVIDNASISYADVDDLSAHYAHITGGVIDNAKIGYADVNDLSVHYAEIDMANVNNAWLENGVIKNGAIGDAMILAVSANKLTAGTIDAATIRVINLEAKNLKIETAEGFVYVGERKIPTKEFIDSLSKEIQDQIDGVINTYTGAEEPTLSNAPANAWTTDAELAKHIGDVYYIANPLSEKNGYSYRFMKEEKKFKLPPDDYLKFPDGNYLKLDTYSWVLIKDSDVTKALQDIYTMQGTLGDIADWQEDVDDDFESLKNGTLVITFTDGSTVEQYTMNQVRQTVKGNSATLTSYGSMTYTDPDGTVITSLINIVNSIGQTANGNHSSIQSLEGTVGDASSGLVKKYNDLDQTVNGTSSTVGLVGDVSNLDDRVTQAESNITQNADNIATKVSKDGVISEINQSPESIRIKAERIEFDGKAIFGAIEEELDEYAEDDLTLEVMCQYGATSLTFSVALIRHGEDVHAQYPASMFLWSREQQGGVTDLGSGYTKTVARADMSYGASVEVIFLLHEAMRLAVPDGTLVLPDSNYLTITM